MLDAETKRTARIKPRWFEVEIISEALQEELEWVAASMVFQMPNLPEALHAIAIYKSRRLANTRKHKSFGSSVSSWAPKQESSITSTLLPS
ncbi:MAG: hypothetical protein U0905_06115 [Pirellulales bacterium]